MNPTVQIFRTACSLHPGETALKIVRFYSSPPASPGGLAFERRRFVKSEYFV
jgi:hypothetical protein